jgi:hypothetical protein
VTSGPGVFGDGTPVPELAPGEQDTSHQTLVDRRVAGLLADRDARAHMRALGRQPIPDGMPLRELLSMPLPEVRYRIDGLWPANGRVICAAQAKTGKTTLRDNLIRSLVDGRPFLDRFDVHEQANAVSVIDVELSQAMLQLWLRDQGIRNDDRVQVWSLRGRASAFDILDDACRAQWAKRLHGTEVLIVDCLGPLLAAFGIAENKNEEVGPWLDAFAALLDEASIADALIVHHMGYGPERSRGASRLNDWPDAMWKLLREEPKPGVPVDHTRYFAAEGRDVAVREGALRYDPIDRHLRMEGGSRSAAKTARDVPVLVAYVADHPDLCKTDLEAQLADEMSTRRRVRDALSAALRDGLLVEVHGPRNRRNIALPGADDAEDEPIRRNPPQPADLFSAD